MSGMAMRSSSGAGSGEPVLKALLARMSEGDEAALADLYDHSNGVLYALALRILDNPQDAEEVLHDVYCRAWRNAKLYNENRGSVMAWLVLMTRSAGIDYLRSRKRTASVSYLESGFDAESAAGSPEDEACVTEQTERIRAALQLLPPEQRHTIELAFFGGYSHSELAENLNLPVGTVKSRIRTGLFRLRGLLEDLGQ